jgi:hypothetical protein
MTGFTRCVSLFPIMAECLIRQRSLATRNLPLADEERKEAIEWIEKSVLEVETIVEDLPPVLHRSSTVEEGDDERMGVFGMQRANLLITTASVRFVLVSGMCGAAGENCSKYFPTPAPQYDYHAAVDPHAGIEAERDASSRQVLQMLARWGCSAAFI